jgi:hypothetical protein
MMFTGVRFFIKLMQLPVCMLADSFGDNAGWLGFHAFSKAFCSGCMYYAKGTIRSLSMGLMASLSL